MMNNNNITISEKADPYQKLHKFTYDVIKKSLTEVSDDLDIPFEENPITKNVKTSQEQGMMILNYFIQYRIEQLKNIFNEKKTINGIHYKTPNEEENDDAKVEDIIKALEKKRIENDSLRQKIKELDDHLSEHNKEICTSVD